jgi:hypothetical protein
MLKDNFSSLCLPLLHGKVQRVVFMASLISCGLGKKEARPKTRQMLSVFFMTLMYHVHLHM